MLIVTIYKMLNASGCYLITKPHEDHQVSKQFGASVSSNQRPHVVWLTAAF